MINLAGRVKAGWQRRRVFLSALGKASVTALMAACGPAVLNRYQPGAEYADGGDAFDGDGSARADADAGKDGPRDAGGDGTADGGRRVDGAYGNGAGGRRDGGYGLAYGAALRSQVPAFSLEYRGGTDLEPFERLTDFPRE
jgi:hypothetical protein